MQATPTVPEDSTAIKVVLQQIDPLVDACTITRYVEEEMPSGVIVRDATYIHSTPPAKQMFKSDLGSPGFEFQSYTMTPMVNMHSSLLGLSRAIGERAGINQVQRTYISPIVMADGTIRPVTKLVNVLFFGDYTYYWTRLYPVDPNHNAPHILDIPIPHDMDTYSIISMADIKKALKLFFLNSVTSNYIDREHNNLINQSVMSVFQEEIRNKLTSERVDDILVSVNYLFSENPLSLSAGSADMTYVTRIRTHAATKEPYAGLKQSRDFHLLVHDGCGASAVINKERPTHCTVCKQRISYTAITTESEPIEPPTRPKKKTAKKTTRASRKKRAEPLDN